jgi:hypothetical protein
MTGGKMLRIISATLLISFVYTPASATCVQSTGYDFAASVNNALDYLTCLHNEQSHSLNDHADIINRQGKQISDLQVEVSELRGENSSLKNDVERFQTELSSVASRLRDLENR